MDHIHTPDDGRGRRKCFINGNEIGGVVFADTKKGEIIYFPKPFRVRRNSCEIYTRKLRGIVTVEQIQ